MLNLSLKTIQKELCRKHARVGNDTENMQACNGQRERLWGCCSLPTKTTSWKSRSNLPLTARLSTCRERMEQLPPSCLLKHKHGLPQTIWGNISGFYRILVQYFVHEHNVYLGFTIQKNKLHPIYRTIKSQDNFTQKLKNSPTQKHTNLYPHHLQTQLKIVSLQNKTT